MTDKTDELMDKVIGFFKEHEGAFTIKDIAGEINVFAIDVELCIMELQKRKFVVVKWIQVTKDMKEMFITVRKGKEVDEVSTHIDPHNPMFG